MPAATCRRCAPRRAASRRQLQAVRHQDLHHLRRTRSDREHRHLVLGRIVGAPKASRHFAVHLPEAPARGRRRGRVRNDVQCVSIDTSSASRPADRGAAVRRPRRRDGVAGGGENRGLETSSHDDAPASASGCRAGAGRAGLPTGSAFAVSASRPTRRGSAGAARRSSTTPRARMLATMRAHIEGCRAMLLVGARRSMPHTPTRRRARPPTRLSTSSWCR